MSGYKTVVALRGLWGRPYLDVSRHLDLRMLDEVDEEVCLALTQVPMGYTGGSHRSMGIVPPSRAAECHVDYGETIRAMTDAEFATFRGLADDPSSIPDRAQRTASFGEERDHPLSTRQMLWLEVRFGVYFPWKGYVELIPNERWEDKADAEGKEFSPAARAFFPKTIAFVRSLPFVRVGRCNVMGLQSNDHGTVHRDGDPDEQGEPDHFLTFCPRQNKRLFVWDEEARRATQVRGRAIWFNDHDWHGVEADPFFRWSLRVDGVFRPDFRELLAREARS